MDPVLPLLADLAVLIGASALVAYVGQRAFGIVPLVGFLIAGAVIGPNALALVSDPHRVEVAAEIGVILLLFTIGIEFSLEKLARIRRLIFGGGSLQLLLTVGVVLPVLLAFGVSWRAALYTAMLATLSSTVIVLKLLADRGATGSDEGQAALGILLFQDLAVVLMVLLLPALAGQGGGASGVFVALAKAALIIAVVLILARRLVPPLLERVARVCSPDIFFLTIIAICFGTAWLAAAAGIGISLGAFLAGLIVSESRFSEHALSEVLPLRILFSAAFFVSVGMLLDPRFLIEQPLLVAGVVGGVFVMKAVTTGAALRLIGSPVTVSASAALLVAQVGEFAFVVERRGAELGLYPGGLPDIGDQAFIAATVLLMVATPTFASLGPKIGRRLQARSGVDLPPGIDPTEREAPSNVVLLGGYGRAARRIARDLGRAGVEARVLTLDPDGADEAEALGLKVVRGDYARQGILEHAGLHGARALVIADDDLRTTERVVGVVRGLRPDIEVIARAETEADAEILREMGTSHVVAVEGAADRELSRQVLSAIGVDPHDASLIVAGFAPSGPGIELRPEARSSDQCPHAANLGVVRPRTPEGCEECLAKGERWVHLRLCMTCGHVGCCDDSPGRHATAHFNATGHAVIRSWEPGEEWAWCYVDEVIL